MEKELMPLTCYSDEELLKMTYTKKDVTALEVELARRLEHMIDEGAKPRLDAMQYVEGMYGKNA